MDYARALVEHPRWRWEPGMVDANRSVVLVVRDGDPLMAWYTPDRIGDVGDEWATGAPPDINHPATKGWLLHMLREATGTQDACATWLGGEWRLYGWIGAAALGRFATEGDALAAALPAAWGEA